ncbi:MAG: hypothetical protein CBD76_04085 [Pelagibacteraceae bacterium TMED216]|nr:MAG: hypothetical protein CBD76_04085 [Pelagibacteraceae bacterium TMED216]|tara:strand:- start:445 stop:747 length:303 start_codon:yes stop_codon:yes gene_type:complete
MERIPNKITKKDISYFISQNTGLSAKYSKKIIEDLINIIISELIRENIINVNNFGTFKILNKSKRIGRNPKNKVEYIIPERKTISFKASKEFLKGINNEI